jgi:hypothetical protein
MSCEREVEDMEFCVRTLFTFILNYLLMNDSSKLKWFFWIQTLKLFLMNEKKDDHDDYEAQSKLKCN